MSKELLAFLKSWIAWVNKGAPNDKPYSRANGLCMSVANFNSSVEDVMSMRAELKILFISQNLNINYPFGGELEYDSHMFKSTQHELPARLDWVRKTIERESIDYWPEDLNLNL